MAWYSHQTRSVEKKIRAYGMKYRIDGRIECPTITGL
jgi:hypothetical protein